MRLQVPVSSFVFNQVSSEGEESYSVPKMFGILYGELFLLIGATAVLVGPKDLAIIARTAGRLVGRAIGHVQLARGQFDSVMQQSQARQVHKELQDTFAQLEAIRYGIRSIPIIKPGPMTRRLMDDFPKPDPNCKDGSLIGNLKVRMFHCHTSNYNPSYNSSTKPNLFYP